MTALKPAPKIPPESSVQVLVLENFPRPEIARQLSPNGRAHWAAKRKARLNVIDHVTVAAITQKLRLMRGKVVLRMVWTYPLARQRDQDNLTTGVTKAVIDTLVNGQWLERDDTEFLRIEPVEVRVEKGVRRLEITLESLPPGASA